MTQADQQSKAKASRSLTGQVTSVDRQQTIHVAVTRLVKEPRYGKYIHRRTRLAVHDAANHACLGDTVEIVPCRRLSKTKSWRLWQVLRKGDVVEAPAQKG